MKLTVVILVYNRLDVFYYSLISVVESIKNRQHVEILVVDDASDEDISTTVKDIENIYNFPIKLIVNPINLGRAENYIKAVVNSSGEFTWLIGSDDFLSIDAVDRVLEIIENYPQVSTIVSNLNHYEIDLNFLDKYECSSYNFSEFLKTQKLLEDNHHHNDLLFNHAYKLWNPKFNNLSMIAFMAYIHKTNEIRLESSTKYKSKFYAIYEWYPNAFFYSSSVVNKPVYYISEKLVTAGFGNRTWIEGISHDIWESYYPLILFNVNRELLKFLRKQGMPLLEYLISQNHFSEDSGQLLPEIVLRKFSKNETKIKKTDYKIFKTTLESLVFPMFYIGVIKGIVKLGINCIGSDSRL